jgi:hypothetical protein
MSIENEQQKTKKPCQGGIHHQKRIIGMKEKNARMPE